MKVSRNELQKYFQAPLPETNALVDLFTFHSFEIDGVEDDVLDIKVLPNRYADCNTIEGIAQELASLLDVSCKDEDEPVYNLPPVQVSVKGINDVLGSRFTEQEIFSVFHRLRFSVQRDGDTFFIQAPAPRTDISIIEDVAEEVARIIGHEHIQAVELPPTMIPANQNRFLGIERMKDELVIQGYNEISSQSFSKTGDAYLANPMNKTMPALRTSLVDNLSEALSLAKPNAPLMLDAGETMVLFEVGSVFPKDDEHIELRMTEVVKAWGEDFPVVDNLSKAKLEEYGKGYEPIQHSLNDFSPYSTYPFIMRDIASWVPKGSSVEDFVDIVAKNAGEEAIRIFETDRFEKDEKVSLSLRIVFQSMERTLTDAEVGTTMDKITSGLTKAGYEVR